MNSVPYLYVVNILYLVADLTVCADKLRQSILLLDFLENLEKLMFNAFEGSACSLPQPTRVYSISQFSFQFCIIQRGSATYYNAYS